MPWQCNQPGWMVSDVSAGAAHTCAVLVEDGSADIKRELFTGVNARHNNEGIHWGEFMGRRERAYSYGNSKHSDNYTGKLVCWGAQS